MFIIKFQLFEMEIFIITLLNSIPVAVPGFGAQVLIYH